MACIRTNSHRSLGPGLVRTLLLTVASLSLAIPLFPQSQPAILDVPAAPAPAQQPAQASLGSISGTVLDATGAELIGATVTLVPKSEAPREILTGNDGQFFFTNVPPGEFKVSVSAKGFASRTSTGVLQPGQFYIVPGIHLPPATANTAVEVVGSQEEIAEAQIKVQEKQRVLGVFPNFYVSYVPDPVPLNTRQKFQLAWKTMLDPVTFVLTGVAAGTEQAADAYSGYGQGAQGYAKRYGAAYADSATDTFIGGAILPSLLHQDPRYYYKGTGSVRSRLLYAIANIAVTRGDNKHWEPNYSALLGGLASGAISNAYYPASDRGVGLTFTNFAIGTASAVGVNILQEFVIRKFTPKTPKEDPSNP